MAGEDLPVWQQMWRLWCLGCSRRKTNTRVVVGCVFGDVRGLETQSSGCLLADDGPKARKRCFKVEGAPEGPCGTAVSLEEGCFKVSGVSRVSSAWLCRWWQLKPWGHCGPILWRAWFCVVLCAGIAGLTAVGDVMVG